MPNDIFALINTAEIGAHWNELATQQPPHDIGEAD